MIIVQVCIFSNRNGFTNGFLLFYALNLKMMLWRWESENEKLLNARGKKPFDVKRLSFTFEEQQEYVSFNARLFRVRRNILVWFFSCSWDDVPFYHSNLFKVVLDHNTNDFIKDVYNIPKYLCLNIRNECYLSVHNYIATYSYCWFLHFDSN